VSQGDDDDDDDDEDGVEDDNDSEDIGVVQKRAFLSSWLRVSCCLVALSAGVCRGSWFSNRSSSSIS
jgi:hypothetical protein